MSRKHFIYSLAILIIGSLIYWKLISPNINQFIINIPKREPTIEIPPIDSQGMPTIKGDNFFGAIVFPSYPRIIGMKVSSVESYSPAADAGIMPEDIIIKIEKKKIKSITEYRQALEDMIKIGYIKVVILRNDKSEVLTLKLPEN